MRIFSIRWDLGVGENFQLFERPMREFHPDIGCSGFVGRTLV